MPAKRDLKLIALSAVFLLFIAGCKGTETPSGAPTTPFLGGSEALQIGFLEGSPPAEVTDGNTFPFQAIVTLKNIGEQDITRDNIKVSLIGFLPSQFNPSGADAFLETRLTDRNPSENLNGRKRDAEGNILEPVESFIIFPDDAPTNKNFNFKDSIVGNNPFIFRANACYKYQTKAKTDICVLQNQIDVAKDAICDPSEAKAVFSSGSPIKVSSFRQNVAGSNKLQLSFDVEHVGSGNIFDPATAADCPKDSANRRAKEDQVMVSVDTGLSPTTAGGGYYQLRCVGLSDVSGAATTKQIGKVKLLSNKRTITCTLDLPAVRNDFVKPLDITVDFNYLTKTDKEVLVKHILGSTAAARCGDGYCDSSLGETTANCVQDCPI